MLKKMPLGGLASPSEMLTSFFGERKKFERKILVAFSGGADSSLLLYALHDLCKENDFSLFAAHVNHGIRGDEAIRDRDFCVGVCKKMGIEIFVLDADVPSIARETGKSIESAARDVRYDFFADVMAKNDIDILATAHNADDNLETLIFRLARGTGLRGLCGIDYVTGIAGRRKTEEHVVARTQRKNELSENICRSNVICKGG